MSGGAERTRELTDNLAAVRGRIESAVTASGRAETPRLIVVTKFFPLQDVQILASQGVRDVGENRDQEAAPKAEQAAALDLRWHFVGQLQSNKARSVVRYAHAVHSVDRPSLVAALEKAMAAEAQDRASRGMPLRAELECFIQVDLADGDTDRGRGGAKPEETAGLAARIEAAAGLRPAGVMAVAPLGADPAHAFSELARISADLVHQFPEATGISAGMSADLEAAVAAGATHLRIGSDVLGARPPLR
ncbi:YggS family pyridoxal phosphate-dependent enzyme [Arthrobacter sp. H5]|uniref:YggS family pyridoxal phosphate-dependent enzyme n=1 Tax=Arthrobacter sp. H5 TaxID=1267973 RepID=UPI0004B005DA|nr:YggS family pyridoxal phosphate-dependent enzyme [Arthrobacter sp. H5]